MRVSILATSVSFLKDITRLLGGSRAMITSKRERIKKTKEKSNKMSHVIYKNAKETFKKMREAFIADG